MAGGTPDKQFGLAPESKFIGCRGFTDRYRMASAASMLSCLQYFLAPTDRAGRNPNPDLRPHITGHSYGFN
jgi:serine protease AprX